MTKPEWRMSIQVRMTKPNGATVAAHSIVIRASSFLRPSSFVLRHFSSALLERAKDRGFSRCDFFTDENQLCLGRLKRFQLPATSNEIEQLRAIGEPHEAFHPNHSRGKTICKSFKAIAGKNFIGTECERFELRLMFVLRRRDLFLPRLRDTEQ